MTEREREREREGGGPRNTKERRIEKGERESGEPVEIAL